MWLKCVAVAMSGGVDSSVAAAILKNKYYQVFGVTMLLDPEQTDNTLENAKEIANILNIPHYVVDLRKIFKKRVIDPFCNEYQQGRTPNPCVECNNHIKFTALLNKVKEMGADYLATGHYARVKTVKNGYHLLKGVDPNKDQSYFLYSLREKQLQYLLLPIGNLFKNQTKRIARELGLSSSTKLESQDICFIPNNDYSNFLNKRFSSPTGDIVDIDNRVLGRHKGLFNYTIGQRQGLGIASDKRLYVIQLDTNNNQVVVGNLEHLLRQELSANKLSWVTGKALDDNISLTAKIRYRSPVVETSVSIINGTAKVHFTDPQRMVAPGQSIVFYQGEVVLGGGIVEKLN
jgi:tRNA-specific 2-thiouridylase